MRLIQLFPQAFSEEMPKMKRKTFNKQNISDVFLEDPEYTSKLCGTECKLNYHSCDIWETWFHKNCNKVPKEVLQSLDKVKGSFWKCEGCLDLKIKNDKLKQSFEKKTHTKSKTQV